MYFCIFLKNLFFTLRYGFSDRITYSVTEKKTTEKFEKIIKVSIKMRGFK